MTDDRLARLAELFPGADPATGWPTAVLWPCRLGAELCHLALTETPSDCVYEAGDCPFHGKFPVLQDGDKRSSGGNLQLSGIEVPPRLF